MEKLYKLRNYQGKNFLERVRYFKIFVLFQKIFKIYLELLFYSELGKLSVEYLQFDTITNIEYMRKFELNNLFISIVLESSNLDTMHYIKHFYDKESVQKIYSHHDYQDYPELKCLLSYNITSVTHYLKNNIWFKDKTIGKFFNLIYLDEIRMKKISKVNWFY